MSFWSVMAAMDASAAASDAAEARRAVEELGEVAKKNSFIANLEMMRKMLVDVFNTGNCDITKVTEISYSTFAPKSHLFLHMSPEYSDDAFQIHIPLANFLNLC